MIALLIVQFPGWTKSLGRHQKPPSTRFAVARVETVSAEMKSRQSLQQRFEATFISWSAFSVGDETIAGKNSNTLHAARVSITPALDPVAGLMSRQC
jgi:hypothetical protein